MSGVRAAVTERPGVIALREFPMPDPAPGAVIMKVHYSGICGTDKHTFRGESKQYAGTPHERDLTYPLICGHENVGEVVATGGEVHDSEGRLLKPGDRIVPAANVACGDCHFCRNGYPYYMCENLEDYGNSLHCGPAPHLFGGWSEHMYLLPGTQLFRVPDELPDHVAVLTEIMSVTHGVETAQALLGLIGGSRFAHSVAVLGVGPLGLCHLIKAKLLGAGQLIATDRFPSRLALAEAFGASLTISVETTDMAERIARAREHTGGHRPRHRARLQRLSRDLPRGPQDGAGGRRGGRGRHLRRHGTGRDQSQLRHLHQERQRHRRGRRDLDFLSALHAPDGGQSRSPALRSHRHPPDAAGDRRGRPSSWRRPMLR